MKVGPADSHKYQDSYQSFSQGVGRFWGYFVSVEAISPIAGRFVILF